MVTGTLRPDDLLRHARAVAHRAGHRQRPEVWLRRSTSASYYAVFHAIALAVAAQLAPDSSPDDRYRLTRSVGHDRLAEVCGWLGRENAGREHVRPIVARLRGNADLVELATIFVRLQQARHEADYDHLVAMDPEAAVTHHLKAARALALVERLRATPDGQEFLALVALHSSLR